VPLVGDFRDDFDGDDLDTTVWFPHYLPAWSSRAETAASYRVAGSELTLDLPTDQGLWCADDHPTPLRVSAIQSGSWSGPVGSTRGQQRFRDGLLVAEEQPRLTGWLPSTGEVAVRCRMDISPRSMAAMWLSGFEEEPDDAGEICLVEVFGDSFADDGTVEVGVGVKQVNDPRLRHDFVQPRLSIDVSEPHTYTVRWDDEAAVFDVDEVVVHRTRRPPTYPMQAMLAVFDFPDRSVGGDDDLVPMMAVDWVSGRGR
jgi:hypothetical protein